MSNSVITTLRLEGPLQAWGSDARWDYRGTDLFPTKSGIIGLLGCALGIARNDDRLVDISRQLRMATRADRPGIRIVDYQTVTGSPLLNAEGKKRSGSQTFISRREYLSDASFLVALEGPADLIKEIEEGLRNPRWSYYLGRKNCIPSRPVLEKGPRTYESLDDALRHHPISFRAGLTGDAHYTCETEIPLSTGAQLSRSDLLNDGASRTFNMRTVYRGDISCT